MEKVNVKYTFEYDSNAGYLKVYNFDTNVLNDDPKYVDQVLELYKETAHENPKRAFSNYADPNNNGLTRFFVENDQVTLTLFVYETQNEYCKDIMNVLNSYTNRAKSKIKEKEKFDKNIKNLKVGAAVGALLLGGFILSKTPGYYNVDKIEQDIKAGKYNEFDANDDLSKSKEISEQKRKERAIKAEEEAEKYKELQEQYIQDQTVKFDDWNDPYTPKATGAVYNGDNIDQGAYVESDATAYQDSPKVKTLTNE